MDVFLSFFVFGHITFCVLEHHFAVANLKYMVGLSDEIATKFLQTEDIPGSVEANNPIISNQGDLNAHRHDWYNQGGQMHAQFQAMSLVCFGGIHQYREPRTISYLWATRCPPQQNKNFQACKPEQCQSLG